MQRGGGRSPLRALPPSEFMEIMSKNVLTEYLAERFPEVQAKPFYRYVFPDGALALQGEGKNRDGRYTGIVKHMKVDRVTCKPIKGQTRLYKLTDDLQVVETVITSTACDDFFVCSPLSYAGSHAMRKYARWLYAFVVDVDRVYKTSDNGAAGLDNFILHVERGKMPRPTFIVSSGNGFHLYYVLDNPLPLYQNIVDEAAKFHNALTSLLWHNYITDIGREKDIEKHGIFQGYRMVGTLTKAGIIDGTGERARAFFTGERVTVEYLNTFIEKGKRLFEAVKGKKSKRLSRAEAARLYPEWWERVKQGKKAEQWAVNRAVYDWWKAKITENVSVGHRYWCAWALVVMARKCCKYDAVKNPCPVTRAELKADLEALIKPFDALTNDKNNHFTDSDIKDALRAFETGVIKYPLNAIMAKTGITIEKNKRNGRKQTEHLKIARFALALANESNGAALQGRKSKFDEVVRWRLVNPEGRKCDCRRDTGLSEATITRHWTEAGERARAVRPVRVVSVRAHIDGEDTYRTAAVMGNGVARLVTPETVEDGKSGAELVAEWEAESQKILAERGDAARAEWKAEQEEQLRQRAEYLKNNNAED